VQNGTNSAYRIHSAHAAEFEPGRCGYTVTLETFGGLLHDVVVHPELDAEVYELSGLRGPVLAVQWCRDNEGEVCRACERARDGVALDAYTRVWFADGVDEEGEWRAKRSAERDAAE
jgi:hypothetical protein